MNSYDRIYNLLVEEAFLLEQRRLTSRQKLGITTGLLGALTTGVSQVGSEGTPPAFSKSSVTRAVKSKRTPPELPSVSISPKRKAALGSDKSNVSRSTGQSGRKPFYGSWNADGTPFFYDKGTHPYITGDDSQEKQAWADLAAGAEAAKNDPFRKAMTAREKAATTQREIDQQQSRIDYQNRKRRGRAKMGVTNESNSYDRIFEDLISEIGDTARGRSYIQAALHKRKKQLGHLKSANVPARDTHHGEVQVKRVQARLGPQPTNKLEDPKPLKPGKSRRVVAALLGAEKPSDAGDDAEERKEIKTDTYYDTKALPREKRTGGMPVGRMMRSTLSKASKQDWPRGRRPKL